MATQHQIGFRTACGVWAALCLGGAMYASWLGYGGHPFVATLTTFALYFGAVVVFAARNVSEFLSARFGSGVGYLFGVGIFLGYLIYAFGTNSFTVGRVAAITALIFVPLALAASAERKPPGVWQDYVTIAGVWTAVKFSPSHWFWPYPGNRLAYVFTVLLCVNVALATFVLGRRFNGVGYNIGWGPRWTVSILSGFLGFAAISIPLGTVIHFVQFAPKWNEWRTLPFLGLAILCFTAWPEEFLFRGLLQNTLTRSRRNENVGWIAASVLFGFSHITNMGFPNWRYVMLASIAGMFYGWTWRKTGSIFASAIVHALVDALWHFLFRTL
ncbi:MAG TPA: CPBP family intramembrane glutamic endopeptidase [Candidatus Sulfotelmatobacter sp.]|nr:CPBP family intramembrane glutamic endopeptidase [Candidatus Sulfotelmatobacter sp.]